mgnify:CR=1 FL=1
MRYAARRMDIDTILALGQMLVSVALMASILLQARGAGLGAAFGGDSSVYRSRRGIEKRLFQFTVALGILFVVFSVANYAVSTPIG